MKKFEKEMIKLKNIEIDKLSYFNTDEINISLLVNDVKIPDYELTCINAHIYEISDKRNEHRFGFGADPKFIDDNNITFTRELSTTLKDGIYFISTIKLIYKHNNSDKEHHQSFTAKKDFEPFFFHITHLSNPVLNRSGIQKRISKISEKRNEYRNQVFTTENAQNSTLIKTFEVFIFGIGCRINSTQELAGFTIYPIKNGIGYSNMNTSVNEFFSSYSNINLPFNKKIDEKFRNSAPLFVIVYSNVQALDFEDAFNYCANHSELVFSIMAFKRGQRPKLFANVIQDIVSKEVTYDFEFPGYKGNLISDLSPTATANEIDKLLPLLEKKPWLKLIYESFAFAINEKNKNIKHFRLWAILELIAKKEVQKKNIEIVDADGNHIQNNGKNVTTEYASAKVYHYVYLCKFLPSSYSSTIKDSQFRLHFEMGSKTIYPSDMKQVKLWDLINAFYAIRNNIAHKGYYDTSEAKKGNWKDKLGARFYDMNSNLLVGQLELMVKRVIDKQIETALILESN